MGRRYFDKTFSKRRKFIFTAQLPHAKHTIFSITNILQNLSTGTKKKTVIFITHQMSAVAATADRIFVMHKGKIIQAGNHAELLGKPGLYQLLWQQQNQKNI